MRAGFAVRREVPAMRERAPMPRPPGFRTMTIVDDNGHLLPGTPKRMTAFSTGYEATSPKRWPVSPVSPFTGVATMGYKGIQTDYLPTNTVYMRNNPDSDEFKCVGLPIDISPLPNAVLASSRALSLSLIHI